DPHQCGSQVACEGFWIRERTARGVDVDHWHGFFSFYLTAAVTFAAASINRTTSSGWDTIARWLELTSIVLAPIRLANMRSASGGIASSLVATRYQEGCDFQAGTPITSSKVLIDSPCWTAHMTIARLLSTSEAKWVTKSSSGSQAKACSSTIRWASAGVGVPPLSSAPSDSPLSRP